MSTLPSNPSATFKKLNPHLYLSEQAPTVTANVIIRQSSKPVMNKLEANFLQYLEGQGDKYRPHILIQAMRFRLANGCWYTPDFIRASLNGELEAFEVKGRHTWDDAKVKLKVFADQYPWIDVWLVHKPGAEWKWVAVNPVRKSERQSIS